MYSEARLDVSLVTRPSSATRIIVYVRHVTSSTRDTYIYYVEVPIRPRQFYDLEKWKMDEEKISYLGMFVENEKWMVCSRLRFLSLTYIISTIGFRDESYYLCYLLQ